VSTRVLFCLSIYLSSHAPAMFSGVLLCISMVVLFHVFSIGGLVLCVHSSVNARTRHMKWSFILYIYCGFVSCVYKGFVLCVHSSVNARTRHMKWSFVLYIYVDFVSSVYKGFVLCVHSSVNARTRHMKWSFVLTFFIDVRCLDLCMYE